MPERALLTAGKLLLAAAWITVAISGRGQGAATAVKVPTYDVVSIRPNKSGPGMMRVSDRGDRYSGTNVQIALLITYAYDLKTADLISGLPGWADSAHFDIEAKMDEAEIVALNKLPPEERTAQRRLMMQSLLAERFHLKVRRVRKEVPIYALVIAKGGFKLKDADPNNTYANGIKGPDGTSRPGMMSIRNGQLTAQAISISSLAADLSPRVDRIILDKTGLKGKYDISLQWSPDEIASGKQEGTETNSGPSIFTALQEQLGLKLEATKGPVDTIVIDHVETPSEN